MGKRNRRLRRERAQQNRASTDRIGEPRQKAVTPENKKSDGAGRPNRGSEAQKPQFEWIAIEHRDADGNPTLPKELIASTFHRRYEDVPEGTEIRILVLAGYKPNALMMVERKIYEIHRLSVRGWRRSGQIAVEMDGWRQHEADWFNAMRGVPLEVSDGLPDPHNEKSHYIVSESFFKRKIVESVDARGSKTKLQMCEGTLNITETMRSAWQRQAAQVLDMGFKLLLLPVLAAVFGGLLVWWLVSPESQDSEVLQRPVDHRLQGDIDDSKKGPLDRAKTYPPIKRPTKPTEIEKRDSTSNEPKGESSAERSMGDGKKVRKPGSGSIPANLGLEGHASELPGPSSARQEKEERADKRKSLDNE